MTLCCTQWRIKSTTFTFKIFIFKELLVWYRSQQPAYLNFTSKFPVLSLLRDLQILQRQDRQEKRKERKGTQSHNLVIFQQTLRTDFCSTTALVYLEGWNKIFCRSSCMIKAAKESLVGFDSTVTRKPSWRQGYARQRRHSRMAAVPRWPSAAILDFIEPEIAPFDPPTPKTLA